MAAIDYRLLQKIRDSQSLPANAVRKLAAHPAINYRRIRIVRGF